MSIGNDSDTAVFFRFWSGHSRRHDLTKPSLTIKVSEGGALCAAITGVSLQGYQTGGQFGTVNAAGLLPIMVTPDTLAIDSKHSEQGTEEDKMSAVTPSPGQIARVRQ
ncbi:MAG TPA: hypothetical protein VI958_13260, partial [Acidobacteriota bacterium]